MHLMKEQRRSNQKSMKEHGYRTQLHNLMTIKLSANKKKRNKAAKNCIGVCKFKIAIEGKINKLP